VRKGWGQRGNASGPSHPTLALSPLRRVAMKRGFTTEDVKVGHAVPSAPIEGASANGGLGTARPTIFTVDGIARHACDLIPLSGRVR